MTTVRAGPELLLLRKEVWREDGLSANTIHCPTLNALEVKDTITLSAAPYLEGGRDGGKGERNSLY